MQNAAGIGDVTTGGNDHVVGGFDTRGAVCVILVRITPYHAVHRGDTALVEHITADRVHRHVTTGDDATRLVGDVVARQQVQAIAGLDQPAVDQVLACRGRQVVGGPQGTDVVEVLASDQAHVITGNQRTGRAESIVGLGHVQHRHQHFLAVHFVLFEPDDIVGQCRDLLRREGHAYRQVELILAGDGIVHQVLELSLVGVLPSEKCLAGTRSDGLLHQTLFVKAITQALGADVRVVTEAGQQVIRTHELLEVGEYRVGFDQVLLRIRLERAVRHALDTGHGLAGHWSGDYWISHRGDSAGRYVPDTRRGHAGQRITRVERQCWHAQVRPCGDRAMAGPLDMHGSHLGDSASIAFMT